MKFSNLVVRKIRSLPIYTLYYRFSCKLTNVKKAAYERAAFSEIESISDFIELHVVKHCIGSIVLQKFIMSSDFFNSLFTQNNNAVSISYCA